MKRITGIIVLLFITTISIVADNCNPDTLRYKGSTIIINTKDLKEIYRQNRNNGPNSIDGINVNYLYKGDAHSRNKLLYPKGTIVFASIVYYPTSLINMLTECLSQEGIHNVYIYIRGDGYASIRFMIGRYYYRRDFYNDGIVEIGYKEATSDNKSLLDSLVKSILVYDRQRLISLIIK